MGGMAERGRFELPVLFTHSRFPGVRFKPLSHLSTELAHNVSRSGTGAKVFGTRRVTWTSKKRGDLKAKSHEFTFPVIGRHKFRRKEKEDLCVYAIWQNC